MSIVLAVLRALKPDDFCEELANLKDGSYQLVVQRAGQLAYISYEGSTNIKLETEDGDHILFTIVPVRAR